MADFAMPETWTADQKLFPHQVGFTCPPFDYDAAPSDFLRMSPESVGVHGWMLHVPDYRALHGPQWRRRLWAGRVQLGPCEWTGC